MKYCLTVFKWAQITWQTCIMKGNNGFDKRVLAKRIEELASSTIQMPWFDRITRMKQNFSWRICRVNLLRCSGVWAVTLRQSFVHRRTDILWINYGSKSESSPVRLWTECLINSYYHSLWLQWKSPTFIRQSTKSSVTVAVLLKHRVAWGVIIAIASRYK